MVEILLGIIIWFQFINWYNNSSLVRRFKIWNDLRKRKKLQPKGKEIPKDNVQLGKYRTL